MESFLTAAAQRARDAFPTSDGTAVTLGLRPEHLDVTRDGDGFSVDLTEALGGVSYAYLVAEDGTRLVVEERGDERSRKGQTLGLDFDPARALVFEKESGKRLR